MNFYKLLSDSLIDYDIYIDNKGLFKMKTTINIINITILLFFFIVGCSNNNDNDNVPQGNFFVEIINKGTTDILDIELSMVGAEEVITINKLAEGQSSGCRTFNLSIAGGGVSISWGDYLGMYTQRDTIKDISILNFEHGFRTEMRIEIEDSSYVIIFP